MAETQVQSEKEEERSPLRFGPIVIGLLLSFPFLYFLSIGPATWLARHHPGFFSTVEIAYYPLRLLYDATGDNAFWEIVIAYGEWWG